jgi:phosphate/sulfate permease
MKDRRIAILFLTIFIDLLGFGIVIPILPNLAKELSVESGTTINPDVAVGLIAAVFSIIQFIFAPLFGSLSDRIGRRPIILGSILVNAFGYVLFGLSQSFWVLILARIISGFGSANISAAQAYIADITSYEDRAKKMGIIGAALIANGSIQDFGQLPGWVPISCYLAIGIGTMSGGWKIVKTMGTKITKVTPLEGVAAETAGAFTLFFTGQMGIPVSTTHTITGSIIGVGATKRLSAVRWGVTSSLLVAWILTIPVSGLLAAIVYWIVRLFI